MRGGTGRLPGQDDEWDPGLQPGSRLNRDVFFHVNTCCQDGMKGGMILVY